MSRERKVLLSLTESELNTLMGAVMARVNHWDDEARKHRDIYEQQVRASISEDTMRLWVKLYDKSGELV